MKMGEKAPSRPDGWKIGALPRVVEGSFAANCFLHLSPVQGLFLSSLLARHKVTSRLDFVCVPRERACANCARPAAAGADRDSKASLAACPTEPNPPDVRNPIRAAPMTRAKVVLFKSSPGSGTGDKSAWPSNDSSPCHLPTSTLSSAGRHPNDCALMMVPEGPCKHSSFVPASRLLLPTARAGPRSLMMQMRPRLR